MLKQIRWRIAIPYIGLILAGLIGLGLYIANFIEQIYLSNLEDRLIDEARLISELLISESDLLNDVETLDFHTKQWASILGVRVTIIGVDGIVVGESAEDRTQMDNHLNRPEIIQAMEQGSGIGRRFSSTVGFRMIYTAYTIRSDGQVLGFVRLSMPLTQVEAYSTDLRWTLMGAAFVVILCASGLAVLIASGVTRPIRALTKTAQQVSTDERLWHAQTRIPSHSRDEIALLTQALNEMIEQLGNKIYALSSETAKMNAILDQMTDGVLIIDPDGIVQLMNPAAETMFKTDQLQAIGHPYAEVVRHHQLMDVYNECRISRKLQIGLLDLPVSSHYLQVVATPFEGALPGSILLIVQDLTQLRHLETVRRDFISNISHELRTPLASLKAVTETLLDADQEDSAMVRHFLNKLDAEVDLLNLIVSELLELSRIESGKAPLVIKKVNPGEILASVNERLNLQAQRAGLMIELVCPLDLPKVHVDQSRIEQVLVNLIHNSIKFTPSGGKITLSVNLSSANSSQPELVFSVADTGIGIAEDDIPRIFERFYKADRARSGGGTGLGLAISRHIVELHDGKIWVISREGEGSTFYFTIPHATDN